MVFPGNYNGTMASYTNYCLYSKNMSYCSAIGIVGFLPLCDGSLIKMNEWNEHDVREGNFGHPSSWCRSRFCGKSCWSCSQSFLSYVGGSYPHHVSQMNVHHLILWCHWLHHEIDINLAHMSHCSWVCQIPNKLIMFTKTLILYMWEDSTLIIIHSSFII